MKKRTCVNSICILAAGLMAVPALAADVGFGVNLNIGNMPVVAPAPVYVPAPVMINSPPTFIAPPSLGISIAVGVPYDMFMVSGNYYVYKGSQWYCGPRYSGPWHRVSRHELPRKLRGHDIGHYRQVRDREYQAYHRDRDHYRGRYYQARDEGRGRSQEYGRRGEQVSMNQSRGEWQGGRDGGQRSGEGHGRGDGQGRGERHGRE